MFNFRLTILAINTCESSLDQVYALSGTDLIVVRPKTAIVICMTIEHV